MAYNFYILFFLSLKYEIAEPLDNTTMRSDGKTPSELSLSLFERSFYYGRSES